MYTNVPYPLLQLSVGLSRIYNSSVTLVTDLIDIKVNASSLGINWNGNYRLAGNEVVSAGLDIVGIFDPTGVADGTNALLQAKSGDWFGATISGLGVVPYLGDAAKVFKVGKDFKIIKDAINIIQRNRIIGKMAESQITKGLVKCFGKDATVGEQITARFSDGSKVVFDNVVVKNGKVVLVNETKSGKATLSAQQKRFFKQNETVTFVGNKAERLGIKGAKVNASSTKTKISHVDVEKL